MGIFKDIKKIFWANKAIAKNAANKATDAAKEKGEELSEKANEFVDEAKDKATDFGDILKEKANDAKEKAEEFTENLGGTIITAGSTLSNKAQDMTEDLGAKLMGKEREEKPINEGDDLLDEIMRERNINTDEGTTIEEPTESIFMDADEEGKSKMAQSMDAAKAMGANIGQTAKEKGSELLDTAKKTANDIGEAIGNNPAVKKAAEVSEQVGDKVLDTGEEFMEKLGGVSEKIGEKVIEKGGEALDKFGDLAEGVGSKILQAKDDLIAKAEAEAAQSGETFDSVLDKLKDLDQTLKDKITGSVDPEKDFADTPIDMGGSELNKHGSFWDKAEKYAQGNYTGEDKTPEKPEGELTIQENPDFQKKLNDGSTKGFEDLDGDGNDLIDDAILDED